MLSEFTEIKEAFKRVAEFKQGQDKFKEFSQEIFKNFKSAKILLISKCPEEKMLERALFLSIANKIFERIKAGDKEPSENFISVINKYKKEILAKSKENETSFEAFIEELHKIMNHMDTSSAERSNNLIFYTILTICNKTENTSFFGKGSKYSKSDLNKLSQEFKFNINLMDYDDSVNDKKLSKEFSNPTSEEVYLLKAKNRYLILYPLEKTISKMRITQSQNMEVKEVENIFRSVIKSNSVNGDFNDGSNSGKLTTDLMQNSKINLTQSTTGFHPPVSESEPLKSSKISLANSVNLGSEDSFLRAVKVVCIKCNESFSEYDCLPWNYNYYCPNCIGEIKIDTSEIPKPRMLKYLKERNFPSSSFKIVCPECGHFSAIKNYDPSNKPKRFTCLLCDKTICIKHNANIYSCFCFCPNCKKQTISLSNLNISYCQDCRNRHCSTCQETSKKFCACICRSCYKLDLESHECEPVCHYCRGKPNKMKTCECGLFICYCCYYSALEKFKELQLFPCVRE